MAISDVIKEKRKESGLTQEQIASYLGVTAPAVNKWEKGISYPDVTLLSPLARVLGTDLNTLLCFHEELTDQEIGQFSNQVMEKIFTEGFQKGYEMAKEKMEEYPSSMKLLHSLALLLDGAVLLTGMNEEERKKQQPVIIALYKRLAACKDPEIKNGAIFMLASKYTENLEFEKSQEMIDQLPEQNKMDKQILQAHLYAKEGKPDEAETIHEKKLCFSAIDVWNHLLSLMELEGNKNNPDNVDCIADICSSFAETLQLSSYYQVTPGFMAAVVRQETDKSLLYLEELLNAGTEMGFLRPGAILYQHISKMEKGQNQIPILPALLQEINTGEKYEFMRKCPKYTELMQKYGQ